MASSEPIYDWFAYIGRHDRCQRTPGNAVLQKFSTFKINALSKLWAENISLASHRSTFSRLTQCRFNEELVLYWVGDPIMGGRK
jgi:hypothetical protein